MHYNDLYRCKLLAFMKIKESLSEVILVSKNLNSDIEFYLGAHFVISRLCCLHKVLIVEGDDMVWFTFSWKCPTTLSFRLQPCAMNFTITNLMADSFLFSLWVRLFLLELSTLFCFSDIGCGLSNDPKQALVFPCERIQSVPLASDALLAWKEISFHCKCKDCIAKWNSLFLDVKGKWTI